MSQWFALKYPLKAGSEEVVAKIFQQSGRPEHTITAPDGTTIGHLLTTLVFMGKEMAIRVIEVEGDLRQVAMHMSRQQQVRDFEREIEPHLAVPRDMVTPGGAQQFFRDAGLECVLVRQHDQ